MDVFLPRTLDEALDVKASRSEALPIAGGTDIMVDLNFDRRRPPALLDLSRLPELQQRRQEDGTFFLGAGVTYSRIVRELPQFRPLVEAARSVGSPQIRNRGTVGGNLGTASPAGAALPVLAAYDAEVGAGGAAAAKGLTAAGFGADPRGPVPAGVLEGFCERVAVAPWPIDDVRGTA